MQEDVIEIPTTYCHMTLAPNVSTCKDSSLEVFFLNPNFCLKIFKINFDVFQRYFINIENNII